MTKLELIPVYSSQKSFYKKAYVEIDGNVTTLRSYNTEVVIIMDGEINVLGRYSPTVMKHIKEFLEQLGHKAENSKQILKDYGVDL